MKSPRLAVLAFALAQSALALPQVIVVRAPRGIMQPAGGAAEHDDFVLANVGADVANVTLASNKQQVFNLSPAQFAMDPGTTRTITVIPGTSAGGQYDAIISVFVAGTQTQLTVPERMFIAGRPAGLVNPQTSTGTIIINVPAGQPHSSSVPVRNAGNVGMQGLLLGDAPWLVPNASLLNIGAGSSAQMAFDVNAAARVDGDAPLGAAVGNLSMIYLKGTANTLTALDTPSVSATVIDIQKVAVVPSQPPALAAGEAAAFLPAITDLSGYFSEVFLSNRGTTGLSNVRLFYNAAGASPASSLLANIAQFPTTASAWFPVAPSSLFNVANQLGGLQVRNAAVGNVSISSVRGVIQGDGNRYLTAMPTMTSDASIGAGERLLFAGIEKSATARTDVVVQETAGFAGSYIVDFFDASGAPLAPSATGSLLPFGTLTLSDAAPAGARSARLTNSGGGGSRLTGFALVADATTADEWTVVASAAAADLIVPIPSLTGAPASTFDVWIANGAATPTPVTIITKPEPPHRRAMTPLPASPITFAPGETRKFTITGAPLGYARISAPIGTISASGRLTSTVSGRAGSFGTGVPAVATTLAAGTGTVKRFSRAADGPGVAPPLTLLLIETSGQPAMAKVTIHFTFPAGSTIAGQVSASQTYTLKPNQLMTVTDVARSILGAGRDSLGAIYNVNVDVEVIGGNGRVLSFVQTLDASGDITFSAD